MSITSISLSYVFLGITIITIGFFLYFKTLLIKTSKNNDSRDKIIGNMKDPISWTHKNNIMSFISLFWAIVSLAIFIYLKFFFAAGLISIIYPFIYLALISASLILIRTKKTTAK